MESKTILVTEDNRLNMKLVRGLLQLGGYKVLEAEDAESCLHLVRTFKPDLILMDIQLPDKDGLSATRIIKEDPDLKEIPIVALTAHAMQGDEQRALDAGCVGYITKPIDTRAFLDQIVEFLNTGKARRKFLHDIDKNRVLIVDDDPLNVKLLAAQLPADRYKPIRAYSGKECLEKVAEECPDLILLDIMMPAMDGYEVTRKLKSDPKTKDIPVILITALNGADDKARGLEAGADEFLNKPVNTAELLARLHSLLRLRQYQDQLRSRNQSKEFFTIPTNLEESSKEDEDLSTAIAVIVEDNGKDAKLIQSYLDGEPYQVERVRSGEEIIALASREKVDILLLDILLPVMDGFKVCQCLKKMERTRNIQIIIITCLQDLENKIKSIELGADDYLVKPINSQELKARVRALAKKKIYLDKLSSNYEIALYSAITDKITGLYNQAYFKHFLKLELKRSLRQKHSVALIMIDIDDFKLFNDTMGHLEGDRILKEFGELIRKNFREVDLIARYGGEEFGVVLPYTDQKCAFEAAERLRKLIGDHSFFCETVLSSKKLTISQGIATCPLDVDSSTVEELIQKADSALYKAKRKGKNRVCLWDGD